MINKTTNTKLYNALWYLVGSMSYGFTSLVYLIIITRIIGVNAAGQFSFAFAVAASFYVIGSYFGSAFQITDSSNNYVDTDYIYNRITTIIIMIFSTLLFSIVSGYSSSKQLLILLLIIYRAFDAFLDTFHAIIQRKDKIYKIGILTFCRTLFLLTIFFVISLIFKNLIISVLSLVVVDLLYTVIFEYSTVRKLIDKAKYNKYKNVILLIEGFSVFVINFLAIYILNSPKYLIDIHLNNELQGIFGIIFMPSSFMSMVSLYLVHPFLNEMTESIKINDKSILNKLTIKLSLIIFSFGILTVLVTYLIGIPILEWLYNIKLSNYKLDLVIIMIGTIFYSIYVLLSTIIIAMRKNFYQVGVLVIVWILSLLACNYMIAAYGIRGASIAYGLVMLIQLLFYLILFMYLINKKPKRKKIAIRLMGGLGNQMFQYAILRTFAQNNNLEAYIDLRGITNKTHNVYGLDHCNISKSVKVVKKYKSIKSIFSYFLYGLSWVIFKDNQLYEDIQPVLNKSGIYCAPLGYVDINKPISQDNYMIGYFASSKYINTYGEYIKKELQIVDKLDGKNKIILEEIKKNESVCIHVRKGDYVDSMFDVCTVDYYQNAYQIMKKKLKKARFYVFSDNIDWVKENIMFDNDVIYIDWKNNQYQDLKLMSSCKNYIISNSTFSWWAQFLCNNKNKIVIAPSVWYRNGKKSDIYDENWILIDVNKNSTSYKSKLTKK